MKTKLLLLVLTINLTGVFAHNKDFKSKFNKADSLYEAANYYQALPLFIELYKQDTTNANVSFLVGDCYLNSRSGKANAAKYFEKAIKSINPKYKKSSDERGAPVVTYKRLGDAYHINSNFDKAIVTYQTYQDEIRADVKNNGSNLKDADRKIQMCNTAKSLVANPVRINVENMGNTVNSSYADYCPVLTADQSTLIFTSRRPGTGNIMHEGKYMEDIYISQNTQTGWGKAEAISSKVNTESNEASVGISPDGQNILIYKDDNGDGNIYSTSLNGDEWSTPVKLNSNINTKYWEPSAFISADGRAIYFVSNRPGGYGGRDIYVSMLTEKGDWGKAVNMGPTINTEFDEDAPFIHPDGITLYFSSNGHNTMGGFDVFYSSLSDDGTKWLPPVNMGYPVNSPDDDVFFIVSPDKTKAYYSSSKEGGYGEKDNYMVTFLDQKPTPLTLIKGVVKTDDGKIPKDVVITVTDNETGELAGVYRPNSKTGQYLFILPPGKNYNIAYEAEDFLFYSENRDIPKKSNYYEIFKAVQLPPVVVGSKIVLNNIFFDFDKATLRNTSSVELKNILRFLDRYPKVVIEISGHTDSKGTAQYNLKLSQERASAVTSYLISKGISRARLISKGYGQTMPAAPNTNADGTDNPEGRQLNRRVELKIVEINK